MKKGIIRISEEIYNNNWDIISDMFKEFKPYHIEFSFWENNVYRFHGTSERFKELKEGDIIPFYDVEFDTNNKTFSFKEF